MVISFLTQDILVSQIYKCGLVGKLYNLLLVYINKNEKKVQNN